MAITDYFESLYILSENKEKDEQGGYYTIFEKVEEFKGYFFCGKSSYVLKDEKSQVLASYGLITSKETNLKVNTIIQRKEDNKLYKIISIGENKRSPKKAGIQIKSFDLETYEKEVIQID